MIVLHPEGETWGILHTSFQPSNLGPQSSSVWLAHVWAGLLSW